MEKENKVTQAIKQLVAEHTEEKPFKVSAVSSKFQRKLKMFLSITMICMLIIGCMGIALALMPNKYQGNIDKIDKYSELWERTQNQINSLNEQINELKQIQKEYTQLVDQECSDMMSKGDIEDVKKSVEHYYFKRCEGFRRE